MRIPATSRLEFRLFDAADAPLLFELDQDELVMKYINGGHPSSWPDILNRMVPRMNAYRDASLGYGLYGVFARSDANTNQDRQVATSPAYLGWILVRPMNFFTTGAEHTNLELGWRFKRSCWGQGIASEAATAVTRAVVQQRQNVCPAITHVSAIALPDNHASIAVMKKLGMQYVSRYLHKDPLGTVDVVLYQMPTTTFLSPVSTD